MLAGNVNGSKEARGPATADDYLFAQNVRAIQLADNTKPLVLWFQDGGDKRGEFWQRKVLNYDKLHIGYYGSRETQQDGGIVTRLNFSF